MTLNRFHQYFNYLKEKYPELRWNGSLDLLNDSEKEKWAFLERDYENALQSLKKQNENA